MNDVVFFINANWFIKLAGLRFFLFFICDPEQTWWQITMVNSKLESAGVATCPAHRPKPTQQLCELLLQLAPPGAVGPLLWCRLHPWCTKGSRPQERDEALQAMNPWARNHSMARWYDTTIITVVQIPNFQSQCWYCSNVPPKTYKLQGWGRLRL